MGQSIRELLNDISQGVTPTLALKRKTNLHFQGIFAHIFSSPYFFLFNMADRTKQNSDKSAKPSMFRRLSNAISSVFKRAEEPEPKFEISTPYNFKHVQHVKTDPHSSTGFSVSENVIFFSASATSHTV